MDSVSKIVCNPRAQVWHKTKTGERKTNPVPLYYGTRNRFLFMKRNASRLQFLTSSLYFIPRYLVLRILSLLLQDRNPKLLGSFYRGAWDGLARRGLCSSPPKGNRRPIWHECLLEVLRGMDLDGKRILDVGAGHGNVLIELRDRNVVPYAIEVSGEAVAYLRQHNITAERVDISHETFPYEDSQFDYVICTEVIEHIAYPQYALAEIHRVLKLRGKLFLSTHNSFNLYMRLRYLLGRVPTPDLDVTASGQHLRLMSYKVLLELLRGAGFGTISNRSKLVLLGSVCCGRFEVLTRLLARHFLVVCTKEHC